jgi:hypothetical protein
MAEPESAPPTRPRKNGKPEVHVCSIERMSRILAEAQLDGTDAVARRWRIDPRTVGRYLAKSRTDAALAAAVDKKARQLAQEWRKAGAAALGTLIRRTVELALKDTATLHDVAGAMHLVATHLVNAEAVLGRDTPDAGRPEPDCPKPPPAASGPGTEEQLVEPVAVH